MDFEADKVRAGQRGVRAWLRQLDGILRGDATRLPALRRGTIEASPGGLTVVLVALGMIYGACMGCFALFKMGGANLWQPFASMIKVPALFFLTLIVTLPSLYVFNALVGSRLALSTVVRLLIAALCVMLTVLASLGPIVAFFSVSTTSYPFMVLFNVVVFAASGFLGLAFLLQTLHRLSVAHRSPPDDPATPPPPASGASPAPPEEPGALDRLDDQVLGHHVKTVFRIWVVVFGLVGAQMSWVLRPFVGSPDMPFVWFRPRTSNFFQAVAQAFSNLFS